MKHLVLVALPEELTSNVISAPIVYTGVGLTNAAVHTYEAILKYQPDVVVNYGSAGALKDVNGLLTVAAVCQRDANCEPLRERGFMLGENILYYQSGQTGVRCGSGNNFVTNADQWTKDHCDIVDMELWAIAKVCNKLSIPWISKKWISDKADDNAHNAWENSLNLGQQEFIKWFECNKG